MENLIDCSGGTVINEEAGAARKLDALQRVLRKVPTRRTLVFCNKIETCRKVCTPCVLEAQDFCHSYTPHHVPCFSCTSDVQVVSTQVAWQPHIKA